MNQALTEEQKEIQELEAEIKELEHKKRLKKLEDKKKELKRDIGGGGLGNIFR